MGDSQGPKSSAIPSWQRQEPSVLPKQPDNTPSQEQAERQQPPEPRASLIEQASEFLNDESIRDAPIERKKLFLESKGLNQSEIDNLLQIQNTPEAAIMEDYGIDRQEPSQPTPPTTPSNLSASSSTPQDRPQPTTTPPKDHPPIITYPEFLLHAQTPAPLITAPRLLTSLYLASGVSATIYGTSKYILEPMVLSLTTARHSLFKGASANITALNAKLESAVSRIPETASLKPHQDVSDDTESLSSSDGARFFQRSAGTQTSPRLSRSNSSIASESDERLSSLMQEHTSALLGIQSKLSDLLPTDSETETKNPLGDSISELRTYLEKLPRVSYIPSGDMVGRKGVKDAVANVKAEIRGVKGVLLSARNFPSGVAAR